jgi:hypothetical protein
MPRALCTSTLVSIAALACVGAPASAASNSVARNNVHDLPGSGMILDEFGGDGSDSNTVAGNSVARTGSDGFFVGVSCA